MQSERRLLTSSSGAMEAMKIVQGLTGFANRGAGTDAERRAAAWLANELGRDGQNAVVETFWCRPDWALAHALHAALGVAGSVVAVASPVAGIAILGAVLGSVLSDSLTGVSVGRWLTRQRASQNVSVAPPPAEAATRRVRLLLTANYDAGRTGLVYRDWLRRPASVLRQTLRAVTPGYLGWLSIAIAWLLAIAILRLEGHTSHSIGVAQLPPTVGLLVAVALLVELAVASWSPAAGDNATGVAIAVALAGALQTMPPQHVDVELVLTGAGDGDQIGLRSYLRGGRGERRAANTIVVGITSCAAAKPRWWFSDGPLVPFRYGRPLRRLAEEVAADEPHLQASSHKGRGSSPALPARTAGIPAITLGCLDDDGLAPHSHQRADTVDAVDSAALDSALQFALLIVDAIDAAMGELRGPRTATPA